MYICKTSVTFKNIVTCLLIFASQYILSEHAVLYLLLDSSLEFIVANKHMVNDKLQWIGKNITLTSDYNFLLDIMQLPTKSLRSPDKVIFWSHNENMPIQIYWKFCHQKM